MANGSTDIGNGAVAVFGTSGAALDYTSIDLGEESIEVIETSHLGTTVYNTVIGGDLITPSPWILEGNWDSQAAPVVTAVPELCTATYPLALGQATPATYVASGVITGVKNPVFVNGELQMGTVTFQPDGVGTVPTFTPGVAT